MGRPVIHFEIGVRDLARSREFYSEMFDWDIKTDDRGYGLVMTGSTIGINGGVMETPEGRPPYVTTYIEVDDLVKELARIEAHGGKVLVPATPIEGVGAFAMFADPDGNVLGLMHEDVVSA